MTISLVLCLASVFVAVDETKDDPAKKDLEKFQGTWTVTAAEAAGKALPELKSLMGSKIIFKGTGVQLPGGEKEKISVKLDPSKKPCQIDFIPDKNAAKDDGPELGIYELKGDTLKLAFRGRRSTRTIDPKTNKVIVENSEPPPPRPTTFEDKEAVVLTLKRDVKK